MKPDRSAPLRSIRAEPAERAHLKDPRDASHVMYRYDPPAELKGLVQWFWIPVWSVPAGKEAPQKVLQYPVCLIVVSSDYARFYGVTSGLSTTTLSGAGWAVGVTCAPAAGFLIAKKPVSTYTDRSVDVSDVLGPDGEHLVRQVRAAMAGDPYAVNAHEMAVAAFGDALRRILPIDAEGELVNRLVAFVETSTHIVRVAQLCDESGLSERALQRLVQRRLGLTPKWLIQRRRLHEAVAHLRDHSMTLAEVAALLGYADQPHFSRDFSRVTGMTPGEFAGLHTR